MPNPFDQFDAPAASGGNPFDQFDEKPKAKEASAARKLGDLGLSVAKGVVAVPEAAVGLADLVSGGRAGKFLENEGGAVGFRPKQAKEFLTSLQSDDLNDKRQQFQQADGIVDKFGVAVTNPSLIANAVAESVPLMGAGAVPARALLAAAPGVGAIGAGAIGEGLVGAGSSAEQIRQETEDGLLTGKQALLAGGSGLATGVFGAVGGAAARRLGIADVDTALTQGTLNAGTAATNKGLVRRTAEGVLSEGVLEELPQSLSEQALQNIALDKPVTEGLADAGVMGVLAGGVMGGGAAALTRQPQAQGLPDPDAGQAPAQPPAPPAAEQPPAQPVPPAEVALPPVTPSQAMGIDPNAGVISKVAAEAVDGPASMEMAVRQAEAAIAAEDNPEAGAPADQPVPIEDRPTDELRMALRNAQDPALRKTIGEELQRRREAPPAAPDLFAPDQGAANVSNTDAAGALAAGAGGRVGADATGGGSDAGLLEADAGQRPAGTAGAPAPSVQESVAAPVSGRDSDKALTKGPKQTKAKVGGLKELIARNKAAKANVQDQPQGAAPAAAPAPTPEVQAPQTVGGDGAAEPGAAPAGRAGVEADGVVPASTDATGKPASWVIRNKDTGEVVMETFDRAKVQALNTAKYEALPVQEYLASLNKKTPAAVAEPAATTGGVPESEKAKWIKATIDKSRLNGAGGVQIAVAPNGGITFMGDPRSNKDGKALLANYRQALAAGATQKEIAEALKASKSAPAPSTTTTTTEPTNVPRSPEATQAVETAPQGRQETALLSDSVKPASKYQLPQGRVSDSWLDAKKRGTDHPDYEPTPRQQMLMDEVAKAKDAGAFYANDVKDAVAKALGVDAETRATNTTGVEGGDFGMDVYLAGRALDAKRKNANEKAVAKELNLKPGDKLGTLVFNDMKVTNSVEVESVSDDGLTFNFKGKRGPVGVKFSTGPVNVKGAIERAHEKGKRKDSYEQFIATRKAPAAPAVAAPAPSQQAQAPSTYADGQNLAADDLLAYFDQVVVGSSKGEKVANPRFQIGEVDEATAQEIAKYIDGYDGQQRRLRVSGRTLKHIHEARPAIAREIVEQLPGMFIKPDEVLPDHKHVSKRALLVKERKAEQGQSKQKSYVATVEVEIEVEVRDGFIDIVTIMSAPDRSLREARELKKNWPEGQQRTEQAVNSPHPLTPKQGVNPEADFPDARPAADSVAQPTPSAQADVDADGIRVRPGKGFIEGRFLAEVDGQGVPSFGQFKSPFATEEEARTAAEAWKQTMADRATESAAERARRDRIAEKFRAGEAVTNAEIESLGLRTGTSDMRWFMSTAANLFGLNSRDIRPIVKDLIRTSLTDMGAKREFVPTRQALELIAKSQAQPAQAAAAATAPQAEAPKLTKAEAKDLMEWQDLGQKGGIKTHILTFYESKADKDAKRGRMTVATVTKEVDAKQWTVEGTEDRLAMLGAAKKKAEEVGMARAVADGFVEPAAAAPEAPKKGLSGARAKKAAEAEAQRAAYFTPDNIVKGYGGHDRVLEYTPADADGNWSVRVQRVMPKDGKWMDAPNERPRWHSTQPEAKELAAGPVVKAPAAAAPMEYPLATAGTRYEETNKPITMMTPDAYLATVRPLEIDEASRDNIDDLKQHILSGKKLDPLHIRADGKEDGRHRAVAAKELGIREVPVVDERAPAAAGVVENFGEKLPPARRNMAAKLSEDLTDDKIAGLPLSQIWPTAENEAIEDVPTAAVAHVMREAIPAKPRVAYKVKSWVGKVKLLRDFAAKVMRGEISRDKLVEEMQKVYALRDLAAKIKLLEQIDRAQWKRIGDVSEAPNAIRYVDGQKVPSPYVMVTVDGRSQSIQGQGNVLDHIEGIKAMLGVEAPESKMQFEIRQESRGDRKVFINKKGDKEYRRLMEFASVDEARKAIKEQYADLVAAWEGVKDRDNITERDLRSDTNRERAGKDHRKGRDVTAEEFESKFGFRGGEFGKWVGQGKAAQERQFMLNSAYDALMDLSDLLGIPPKAISLEGSLGIAFGSRGSGWASAHFEPSNLVINLTKTRGAGALAHEWFHALDNYFARKRGGEAAFTGDQNAYRRDNFITYKTAPMMVRKDGKGTPLTKERLAEWRKSSPDSKYLLAENWMEDPNHKQGVRAEVEQAFADLVKALNDSPMLKRARVLDGVKEAEGYWSRVIEMAARSFENFIQTRMMEQGYHNDFLANVRAAPEVGKNLERYPYLFPSEIAPVADAFKALFDTIQTKEDDAGNVAMFSRSKVPGLYSALSREIAALPTKSAPSMGWQMAIAGLVKNGKVKADEVEWSGLSDWLKLQDGKVTKEAVTAYLDANGVQVQEVVLRDTVEFGGDAIDALEAAGYTIEEGDFENATLIYNPDGEQVGVDELPPNLRDAGVALGLDGNAPPPKYAQYTLPGGANYREVLLTLPVKQSGEIPPGYQLIDISAEDRADGIDIPADEVGPWRFRGPNVASRTYKTREEALAALLKEAKADQENGTQIANYRSSHWDDPNVIAHIRVNDRTDADGKRVLFVEEIQSDWGQEGKKKGFANKPASPELQRLIAERDRLIRESDAAADPAEGLRIRMGVPALNARITAMGGVVTGSGSASSGIPAAPFVTKTDGWLNLALKRVFAMAVDGGYDRVAFVSGEQSADRYDLSKRVDSITYEPTAKGYSINVLADGRNIKQGNYTAVELEDIVGKEIVQKMEAREGRQEFDPAVEPDLANTRVLEGVDLKVGGEGMKAFYDQIVPNAAKALLKKVGGGQIETAALVDEAEGWKVTPPDENVYGKWLVKNSDYNSKGLTFDTEQEANAARLELAGALKQPGFIITDAMREKVAGGLPMFAKDGKAKSGLPIQTAQQIVDTIKARWKNAPEVVVVESVQDPRVPEAVRREDAQQRSQGATGEPEGFWYGGKAYIVSGALDRPADVTRVLFHEVLGHAGLRGVFGDGLKPILAQIANMRKSEVQAKAIEYGLDMEKEADRLQAAEEVLAVMAQNNPQAGFVKRAIGAIRAWLRENIPGLQSMRLTDNDIVTQMILPARRFVQAGPAVESRGGLAAFSKAAQSALEQIAKLDGLFAVAKSDKDTLEGVFADVAPGIVVKKLTNIPGRTQYNLTISATESARVIVRPRNPYGEQLYGYDLDANGEMMGEVVGRPGDNPEDAPEADDVWIDVSLLPEGSQAGERVYQAVATYAHNTGKVFIGDPAGLSDQALRRRTEQMLSSALKHGTTRHIAPHPRQISGDAKLGVPGLQWVYGDDNGNVERMIDASLRSIENAFPNAKLIGYDSATNQFYRTDTGQRFADRGQLAGLVGQAIIRRLGVAGTAGATGQAGWRTVARAALFRDLKARSVLGPDNQDGRTVLDGLRAVGPRLERGEAAGGRQPSENRIFYSRSGVEQPAAFSRSPRELAGMATDQLKMTLTAPGKLSWWSKTVGTMYGLAERHPAFKPVFNAAQSFIDDLSYYATDAADMAPKMLPKLENWRDIAKSPISAEDNKAIEAPVNEGTLLWARDESGRPVKVSELEAQAADMTADQKARRLLRNDKISEGVLRMWQGLPQEQYEKLIESRYQSQMLAPGVVWTDAELKAIWKLNDNQIGLYREVRAAIDKSLDNLAKSDLVRFVGKDGAGIKDTIMEAESVDAAALLARDYFIGLAEAEPDRAEMLLATANGVMDRSDKVTRLKAQGYAPLSRFGKYTVDVVTEEGRQYFGLFESMREANQMAARMKGEFGKDAVSQGTLSDESFKLFQGITPETLELFGNMLGLSDTGDSAQDQAFQAYLKLTKNNRSAMKRLIQRKGILGYSQDVGRVLANFIYSNARQTAGALHIGDLTEAINAIPQGQGEVKDVAVKLGEYIKNPQEEAQAFRGMLFAQYLGGNISSAIINALQPFQVSFPYLSQFGGVKQAGAEMMRATREVATGKKQLDPELAAAIKRGEDDGTLSPQEVFQLMAQAKGAGSLRSGDGTVRGELLAKGGNAWSKTALAWGKVFGVAEQFNRRSTFIAAYRIAKAQKIADPFAFAKKTVQETQFIYSKANRPQWARGAIGATVFTFKTYSISYLELLHRMATQGGPEGKRAALLAVAVLLLMGGAGGLPFMEDGEDIADTIAQVMGYNFSSKQAKRELLEELFGEAAAQFIDQGISGVAGVPIDVSGRFGMGNLIPGTGAFLQRNSNARDVLEVLGPAGDLIQRGKDSFMALAKGNVYEAGLNMSPVAIRNLAKGADMAATDMYRDAKGFKVIETTGTEAGLKAIGFQPNTVAKVQEANYLMQRQKDFYNARAADIRAKWARGLFEKDEDMVAEAREEIAAWNEKNPDQRMSPNMPAIWKRVREMAKDKDQRIADTAPKAMRAQFREETARVREAL